MVSGPSAGRESPIYAVSLDIGKVASGSSMLCPGSAPVSPSPQGETGRRELRLAHHSGTQIFWISFFFKTGSYEAQAGFILTTQLRKTLTFPWLHVPGMTGISHHASLGGRFFFSWVFKTKFLW